MYSSPTPPPKTCAPRYRDRPGLTQPERHANALGCQSARPGGRVTPARTSSTSSSYPAPPGSCRSTPRSTTPPAASPAPPDPPPRQQRRYTAAGSTRAYTCPAATGPAPPHGSTSAATLATPDYSARHASNPEQSGHIKIPTIPHNPGKLRRGKDGGQGRGRTADLPLFRSTTPSAMRTCKNGRHRQAEPR